MARFATLLLMALMAPSALLAVDGEREINDACSRNGCFPGDDPGLPVQITEPGSYRLTSSLKVTVLTGGSVASAIRISADDVTLDLGGFVVSCQRASIPSTPCRGLSGFTPGIVGFGDNTTVRNGTIRDMAGSGLLVTGQVENVRAFNNSHPGIQVDPGSTVRECLAEGNGGVGISAGAGSLVEGNVSRSNSGFGVALGQGAGYRGNVLTGNGTNAFNGGVNLGGNVCGTALCP